jgi:hypothetical protein
LASSGIALQVDAKLKHLEFIQGVINRLSTSAFLFKGWAVTIAAGLAAVASSGAKRDLIVVAVIATALFWAIDAFYLSVERCYRELYEKVAATEPNEIDFSMKLEQPVNLRRWLAALFSRLLIPFYGAIAVANVATIIVVSKGK